MAKARERSRMLVEKGPKRSKHSPANQLQQRGDKQAVQFKVRDSYCFEFNLGASIKQVSNL